jgi:hypothetical protein
MWVDLDRTPGRMSKAGKPYNILYTTWDYLLLGKYVRLALPYKSYRLIIIIYHTAKRYLHYKG